LSGTKLSIIIPTLNEEENLGQCVKSLANQTMQDFEVIIADGGWRQARRR